MCDDLIAHHHRISSPSHIPLSNSPTWFTTQSYTDRSLNRTWLFLSAGTAIDRINFHKFFEISPKWSIYSFDKRVLRIFSDSDSAEMVYEMRLSNPPTAAAAAAAAAPADGRRSAARWLDGLKVVEDGAWFRQQHPQRATLADEEDVLSLIDPAAESSSSSSRLGFVTFLGDTTRLLVSEVAVAERYRRSHREREIERKLLLTVVEIAAQARLKVWITARAEDTENLGVYFEMGFVVNRTMWVLEKNGVQEQEEVEKKSTWKLGNWEGGMVGWKEQWAAALDRIMAGQA